MLLCLHSSIRYLRSGRAHTGRLRCYISKDEGSGLEFLESKLQWKPFNLALGELESSGESKKGSTKDALKELEQEKQAIISKNIQDEKPGKGGQRSSTTGKSCQDMEEHRCRQNELYKQNTPQGEIIPCLKIKRTPSESVSSNGRDEESPQLEWSKIRAQAPEDTDSTQSERFFFVGACRKFEAARNAPSSRMLNRKVLITGGTSGIGFSIAKRCIEEAAASVAIVSRSAPRIEQAIARIKDETGLEDAPVYGIVGDLNDHELLTFIQLQRENNLTNDIDTLINCAGESQSSLLSRMSEEEITRLLRVNLEFSIAMSRHFMQLWMRKVKSVVKFMPTRKKKYGEDYTPWHGLEYCVINVSSLLAAKGGVGASVYAASKAGLVAFTRAYALEASEWRRRSEEGPVLRANVILPGFIDTPMVKGISTKARERLEAEIPLGRFGKPEEVADAVMFLVSNQYANNCVLNLDGGLGGI